MLCLRQVAPSNTRTLSISHDRLLQNVVLLPVRQCLWWYRIYAVRKLGIGAGSSHGWFGIRRWFFQHNRFDNWLWFCQDHFNHFAFAFWYTHVCTTLLCSLMAAFTHSRLLSVSFSFTSESPHCYALLSSPLPMLSLSDVLVCFHSLSFPLARIHRLLDHGEWLSRQPACQWTWLFYCFL